MKKINKIWAELAKANKAPQRTKLSANKRNVKLSAIDTVENQVSILRDILDELYSADSLLDEAYEAFDRFRSAGEAIVHDMGIDSIDSELKELYGAMSQIADSASELGMDMGEIYDELDQTNDLISEVVDAYDNFYNYWQRAEFQDNIMYADKFPRAVDKKQFP